MNYLILLFLLKIQFSIENNTVNTAYLEFILYKVQLTLLHTIIFVWYQVYS